MPRTRVGGLTKLDPEIKKLADQAATNTAALSAKDKADRQRVRARYDIDPRLKAAVEMAARSQSIDTSYSQFAEILLTVALAQFLDGKLNAYFQNSTVSRSLHFGFDYALPTEFERVARYGAVDGAVLRGGSKSSTGR